jgi:predicted nucleic acid-binding protein
MIVVADASPLVTLATCDCLEVLDKLFGEVKVSDSVYEEVTVKDRIGSEHLKKYLQGKVVNAELASLVIRHYIDFCKSSALTSCQGLNFNLKLCREQAISITVSASL